MLYGALVLIAYTIDRTLDRIDTVVNGSDDGDFHGEPILTSNGGEPICMSRGETVGTRGSVVATHRGFCVVTTARYPYRFLNQANVTSRPSSNEVVG